MTQGVLLDTHVLLWWVHRPSLLSTRVRDHLTNAEAPVFVSAVNAMEIATKVRSGKLEFKTGLAFRFAEQAQDDGFIILSVTAAHAQVAGGFPSKHKDPWDRLLAAQARLEGLQLASCDEAMNDFGAEIFW